MSNLLPTSSPRTCFGVHRPAHGTIVALAARWTPEQVRGDKGRADVTLACAGVRFEEGTASLALNNGSVATRSAPTIRPSRRTASTADSPAGARSRAKPMPSSSNRSLAITPNPAARLHGALQLSKGLAKAAG